VKTPFLMIELKQDHVRTCLVKDSDSKLDFEKNVFESGDWQKNLSKTAEEFKQILKEKQDTFKQVLLVISSQDLMQYQCDLPQLSEQDRYSYLNLQADHAFPIAEQDRVLCVSQHEVTCSLFALTRPFYKNAIKWLELSELKCIGIHPINTIYTTAQDFTGLHYVETNDELLLTFKRHGKVVSFDRILKESSESDLFELRAMIGSSDFIRSGETWSIEYCAENDEGISAHKVKLFESFSKHVTTSPQKIELEQKLNFLDPLSLPPLNYLDEIKKYKIAQISLVLILPILIGCWIWWDQSTTLNKLSEEWSFIEEKVERLETQQSKLRTYKNWMITEPLELQLLESLTGHFPNQGEAWIKSLQIKTFDKVELSGVAKNSTIWMLLLKKLKDEKKVKDLTVVQVQGEVPLEFQLSFKWSLK